MPLMFMPFKKFADFSGRARRAEYWWFYLFQIFIYLAMIGFTFLAAGNPQSVAVMLVFLIVPVALFALICLIPNLAVTVRRLHDTDKSALWLLLYAPGVINAFMGLADGLKGINDYNTIRSGNPLLTLAAAICNIVMLYLMRAKGTEGPNRFGDDPKGRSIDVSVFDAPDHTPSPEAHKPVFDFTSATPAANLWAKPDPVPAPMRTTAAPQTHLGTRAPASFGKRH